MNLNSPGDSVEDIEMSDINDIPLTPKTPKSRPDNGHIPFLDADTYDEYGDSDDGSRGLLSGSIERSRFDQPAGKIWAQVKGIVVEVRRNMLLRSLLLNKYATQSAPALLMTTVSLLFTGELLDKVSVRFIDMPSWYLLTRYIALARNGRS